MSSHKLFPLVSSSYNNTDSEMACLLKENTVWFTQYIQVCEVTSQNSGNISQFYQFSEYLWLNIHIIQGVTDSLSSNGNIHGHSMCVLFSTGRCGPCDKRKPDKSPISLFWMQLNTLRPRQNGCHFTEDIFKCIFLKVNVWNLIKIPLKFLPKGPFNKIPASLKIMAWRHSGDKPLSEPTMVSLPAHIYVTRPQWVKWPDEQWCLKQSVPHKKGARFYSVLLYCG